MLATLEINVMNVGIVAQEQQFGQVIEHHTYTFITKSVAKAVLVTVIHPLGDPNHRWCLGILHLVLIAQLFRGRVGSDHRGQLFVELLQEAITLVLITWNSRNCKNTNSWHWFIKCKPTLVRSAWSSLLERSLRGDAGGFAVDFLERSAASVDLLHLGVKSGSHGEAGGWEARGQVALGHEVIVENSFYSGSFQGIVLK